MNPTESARIASRGAGIYRLREALWPVAMAALFALAFMVLQRSGGAESASVSVTLGASLVVFAYLVALPLLRVWPGVLLGSLVLVAGLGAGWAQGALLALPLVALVSGQTVFLARRAADAESAESGVGRTPSEEDARLLALALQGQGKLDAAFEKLRQLPAQGDVLGDLYYLGKGYERKHAYAQARDVFAHLVAQAPKYRNAAAHLKRANRLAEVAEHAQALSPGAKKRSAPQAPANPKRLGRYEIDGELGRGSMGKVYAARDPVIGRTVALKTLALSSEFEGHALVDARARFFREAQSAGRLQHPHIVAIYDAGDEDGLVWIAMERLQGHDLSQFSQAANLLAVPVVLDIAARVAEALDYAHQHQVVHRDIKPSNILYDAASDSVKVTDFGIARITDNSRTKTGLVLGTPSFMAPEQIAGHKADGRCDLYALGVTLYQLLTGSLPLRGESMSALMHAIAHQTAPDIRSLRAELPETVAAIVARALEKNPAARFQTGRQMAADLRSALDGLPPLQSHREGSALDYDARTDFHEHPMAQYQDTVLDSAAAPAVSHSAPSRT
ncbi:serine/threonine-protein kinase [Simplicispira suum]|uniref:serine/threonine-protein kinase n=1 Tax=Simplicispira suum TaxID=2109915 RepID=UPI0023570C28|nr:serine/threonine-protein kinase [Simplicispira suum]